MNYILLEKNNKKITFLCGLIVGVIVFILIYGYKVIDVTYDGWLLTSGGDITQHYMGWKIYRNSSWNFPIGLMEGLIYPDKVSIMYMDSIPIFAILFKILSPILPETFQYFGVWGVLCFALQGGLSALIVRRFTKNRYICIISSILFLTLPMIIYRMFAHTSLAAQWIVLLTIYLMLELKHENNKSNILIWSIIASITVTIHIYFLPMVMIILSFCVLRNYIQDRNIKNMFLGVIIPIISTITIMFIIGAFYGKSSLIDGGFGVYSANLNSLLNPQGYSKYINNLPLATDGQYEGLAYLGCGAIILFILAIYLDLDYWLNEKLTKKVFFENITKVCLLSCCIVYLILALSPIVTLNEMTIINIPYPKILYKLLSIFRASGRFMWPICYLIIIYSIRKICITGKEKGVIIFISLCCILQISDLSNSLKQRNEKFSNEIIYDTKLKSDAWNEISNSNYKNMVFLSKELLPKKELWDLTNYAVNNKMTLNDGYISRKNMDDINSKKQKYINELKQGIVESQNIYVLGTDRSILLEKNIYDSLNVYDIDGIIIGVKDELKTLDKKNNKSYILLEEVNILSENNEYVSNGMDENGHRVLWKNGVSYGPYMSIAKGRYRVEIQGVNLNNIIYSISYDKGHGIIHTEEISKNNEKVIFEFATELDLLDLECTIINQLDTNIIIEKIILNRE